MKYLFTLLLSLLASLTAGATFTIEECIEKGEANYPLVRKYGLLEATADIELAEINKSWLPRGAVYGQLTVQNVVPSFPEALTGVLDQMGQKVDGLGKLQYKAGIDVSQTIWDGGSSRARRAVTRAQEGVRRSSLDVELYAVRERVQSLFFAILLTEAQIEQSEVTLNLLENNLGRLRSMLRNGVAMQSDVDMVEAQSLTVRQALSQARSACSGYRKVLGLFIGESLEGKMPVMPSAEVPLEERSDRPELRMFSSRSVANDASLKLTDRSLYPRIGFFTQAYYGYPGMDYFKSMMNRDMSFNILAGVKVSWNIDSFYSRKENRRRHSVNTLDIAADRELFLFNTSLQTASQREAIEGMRQVMADDARIIELRGNVRRAAESQLANGIIDATALLSKISDENIARLNGKMHEIQLIKEIYNLKYTLNR